MNRNVAAKPPNVAFVVSFSVLITEFHDPLSDQARFFMLKNRGQRWPIALYSAIRYIALYSAIDFLKYNMCEIGHFKWLPTELGLWALCVVVGTQYQHNYGG